jgi:nicotinamide mononucleotide (NMN) deamidase PncC
MILLLPRLLRPYCGAGRGLICSLLTESPGTSLTSLGGVVVYTTDLEHSIAGVRHHELDRYGPVSRIVAEQLASCHADAPRG